MYNSREFLTHTVGATSVTVEEPFALFITWTCYGTWLPGDERGHVSNTLWPGGGFIPKENRIGVTARCDDASAHDQAQLLQNWDAVWLSAEEAVTAASALNGAAETRLWRILRAAVMANHVHVVVTDCPDDGPGVRRVLKGNANAELSRVRGRSPRWWTTGGSNHDLYSEESILATMRYVANQHGKLAEFVDGRVSRC
jgi:REP element-mobilizing transposase RayT